MNPEEDKDNDLTTAELQDQDTPAAEEKEAARTSTSPAGKFGLFMVFLLAVAALAGTAYLYTLYTGLNDQVSAKNLRTDGADEKLRSELMDRQQGLQRNLSRLQEEILSLKKSVKLIYKQTESSGQSWSTTEIQHLLQLAVDRLELARDIDGALAALALADNRISRSSDPALQTVRQQIARDIASLQQIERVDLAGTLNRLQAIEQSIDNLPLSGHSQQEDNMTPVEKTAEKNPQAETSIWQQVSNDLASLVTIRRTDGPVMPLLSTDQHDYLHQNIKALILSARISFLLNDRKSYRDSLNQAARWVANYFDSGHRSTTWVINELDALAAIAPAPQLPDIRASLASLDKIMEEKQ